MAPIIRHTTALPMAHTESTEGDTSLCMDMGMATDAAGTVDMVAITGMEVGVGAIAGGAATDPEEAADEFHHGDRSCRWSRIFS